jgi:hypothetical protein
MSLPSAQPLWVHRSAARQQLYDKRHRRQAGESLGFLGERVQRTKRTSQRTWECKSIHRNDEARFAFDTTVSTSAVSFWHGTDMDRSLPNLGCSLRPSASAGSPSSMASDAGLLSSIASPLLLLGLSSLHIRVRADGRDDGAFGSIGGSFRFLPLDSKRYG